MKYILAIALLFGLTASLGVVNADPPGVVYPVGARGSHRSRTQESTVESLHFRQFHHPEH